MNALVTSPLVTPSKKVRVPHDAREKPKIEQRSAVIRERYGLLWTPVHSLHVASLSLGTVALLALGDWLTGADIAFTALYLLPIVFAAWFGHRRLAFAVCAVASALWFIVDVSHPAKNLAWPIVAWNFIAQLGVFCFVAASTRALRAALVEDRDALQREHNFRLQVEKNLQRIERLTTVGKLADGVAHELGTPLNVVGSYGQMIMSGNLAGTALADAGRVIKNQADAMTHIVQQLVDFARAGKSRRSQHDVHQLILAACEVLAPMAAQKRVSLTIGPERLLQVEVDSSQLQQALMNLLVNAIQAVRERGRVHIETAAVDAVAPDSSQVGHRWVCTCIRDDGEGIAAEILPHLFEPFFTTRQVGEGSGLGLAVAYGIVREHGGWITAENIIPRGAEFRLYLPMPQAPT